MQHIEEFDALDSRQQQAVLALLEAPNVSQAANRVGCDRATLYRWLKDPDFAAAYKQAKREALSVATGRLQATAAQHVDTLLAISTDPKVSPASRVAAAKAGLELAYKAADIAELEDKLNELAEVINANR